MNCSLTKELYNHVHLLYVLYNQNILWGILIMDEWLLQKYSEF
jgi:hypothetical protein